ncbi:hypothetical protein LP420_26950 [Massilia sp. B-10]|nr:hypothetical protein LP420_26950 [Massilia sp. B-10]
MKRLFASALTLLALHCHAAPADTLKARACSEPPRAAPEIALPSSA